MEKVSKTVNFGWWKVEEAAFGLSMGFRITYLLFLT